MTDNIELSDCEKTIMNVDEPIYGDLITEIELVDDPATDDKGKESLTDLVGEQTAESAELPAEPEPEVFETSEVLTQDDAVSDFFTVEDAKTDDFDNDMIIGDLGEGIDFKNDTDVAECHHEYESKKLLFGDCEDIVDQPVLVAAEVIVIQEVEIVPQDDIIVPPTPEAEIIAEEDDIVPQTEEIVQDAEIVVAQESEIVPQEEEIVPQEEDIISHDEIIPQVEIIVTEVEELLQEEEKPLEPELTEAEVIAAEIEKPEPIAEEIDPSFEIAAEAEESLNRMHVMEDVEEGCDVSGALPSSPGHAEQRPDPPKLSTEVSTPVEQPPKKETLESTTITADQSPPAQNGLSGHSPKAESIPETAEKPSPAPSPKSSKKLEETAKVVEPVQEEPLEETKKGEIVEEIKVVSPAAEVKESQEEVKRDNEEDSSSSESSQSTQSSKRKCEDDDSNASPTKKLRNQIQQQYANHDRILNEYIEASNCGTVDDLQVHTEQLLAEIRTLNELAREKEREWNNILHVKKVKEELLLRMQRKKQVLLMSSGLGDKNDMDWEDQGEESTKNSLKPGNGNPMMVPVVSSSPAGNFGSHKNSSKSRSILPKNTPSVELNGQGECRQGRQGPILDVRSIIADYRQRHPETVPRRGRRLKSVLNTSHNDSGGKMTTTGNVLSMASLALGSGSQVRHGNPDVSNELGLLLSTMDSVRQENSRPSSADSSMTSLLSGNSEAAMSFKDVLVQFARLSQSERQELQAQAAASLAAVAASKPPPPPYPEVTLHPVPTMQTTQVPVTQNSSLLHGILTKTQPRADSKPTTFSPTLARLLTAPERVSNNSAQAMYTAALNSGVSISDLLQTTAGKSRNEITITPVGQYGQNMKHKDGEHLEEEEAEDSADRLVIDEGNEVSAGDRNRADNGSEAGDDVPQCQGCHQKSAQFVCAGCGNQWYCSRDCQVAAWDEHSEVCSG